MSSTSATPLPGGGVGGAAQIGDLVRRPTGFWTPAVRALLDHLQGRLDAVPRHHGVFDSDSPDGDTYELLDYLPGDVIDVDAAILSDAQLVELSAWTRRFHDAARGFTHPGPWRLRSPEGATLIGHGDLAAWNVCFAAERLAGVFDWDLAGPTTPLRELAWLTWSAVPLFTEHPADTVARRITLIAETYGGVSPLELLDAVPGRVLESIDAIVEAAAAGDAGMRNLMSLTDNQDLSRRSLAGLLARREAIETALSEMTGPARPTA